MEEAPAKPETLGQIIGAFFDKYVGRDIEANARRKRDADNPGHEIAHLASHFVMDLARGESGPAELQVARAFELAEAFYIAKIDAIHKHRPLVLDGQQGF